MELHRQRNNLSNLQEQSAKESDNCGHPKVAQAENRLGGTRGHSRRGEGRAGRHSLDTRDRTNGGSRNSGGLLRAENWRLTLDRRFRKRERVTYEALAAGKRLAPEEVAAAGRVFVVPPTGVVVVPGVLEDGAVGGELASDFIQLKGV